MYIYGSIFAIVNSTIADTLPDIDTLLAAMQAARAPLSLLPQECAILTSFIQGLTTQNAALLQRDGQLSNGLAETQAMVREKDLLLQSKDQRTRALESTLEAMQEKIEEGIRKGWQLEELRRMLFGKKSERYTAYSSDISTQPSLGIAFDSDDVEAVIAASRARAASEKELRDQQQGQPKTNRHQKHYQVRKGKRTRINALEQVVTEVDYPGDKAGLKPMGKKVVVVYDYLPGKIIKSETHFLKYIDTEGHIFKAPVPPRVIERGTVSNRLVAQMHTEKFVYYSPYYRQLQKLRRMGIVFAASTVNDWEEICYKKLKRLLKLMKRIINQQDYLQIDEVPINYVNDVGKGHCSRGYFWVVNAPRQKFVFFQFNEGRSNEVPKELLKDFKGKLQCDGLSAYKTAFKDSQVVTLMTCLVHIRRDFFKALKNNKALAEYFLNETRIIYDLEAYADKKQLSDEARTDMRKKHVKPILDQLKGWLLQHQSAVPPDSPISKAVNYALNHWHMLDVYVEDGKLLPDNNGVERAIRPVTLYRKNSLFAGNEHGAERAALFFSLLETCKLHDLDPFEYLCDVYERIHDCPAHQLEELLPHKWKKSL